MKNDKTWPELLINRIPMETECSKRKLKTNFSIHKFPVIVAGRKRFWRDSRMDDIIYLRRKHDNRFLRFLFESIQHEMNFLCLYDPMKSFSVNKQREIDFETVQIERKTHLSTEDELGFDAFGPWVVYRGRHSSFHCSPIFQSSLSNPCLWETLCKHQFCSSPPRLVLCTQDYRFKT